jgi:hypothetical protein
VKNRNIILLKNCTFKLFSIFNCRLCRKLLGFFDKRAYNVNLSMRSAIRPTSGIIRRELHPETINNRGNCSCVTPRLLTAKALLKGIIINPPIDRKAVAKKPMR